MTRAALAAVEEAIEIGDTDYARAVITSALSDEQVDQENACPDCLNVYKWPGELAEHRLLIHGDGGPE